MYLWGACLLQQSPGFRGTGNNSDPHGSAGPPGSPTCAEAVPSCSPIVPSFNVPAGIVAVSCGETYDFDERVDLSSRLLHSPSLILIWSFTDPIHPQVPPPSLPPFLTHSLTHSLPPSFRPSLLTHSLPPSFRPSRLTLSRPHARGRGGAGRERGRPRVRRAGRTEGGSE